MQKPRTSASCTVPVAAGKVRVAPERPGAFGPRPIRASAVAVQELGLGELAIAQPGVREADAIESDTAKVAPAEVGPRQVERRLVLCRTLRRAEPPLIEPRAGQHDAGERRCRPPQRMGAQGVGKQQFAGLRAVGEAPTPQGGQQMRVRSLGQQLAEEVECLRARSRHRPALRGIVADGPEQIVGQEELQERGVGEAEAAAVAGGTA